jgi:hypothetical protein
MLSDQKDFYDEFRYRFVLFSNKKYSRYIVTRNGSIEAFMLIEHDLIRDTKWFQMFCASVAVVRFVLFK